jgi:hypothetical protein
MQKVPVVATRVVAIAGIEPVEAMHRVTVKAVDMLAGTDAATVKAPADASADAACINTRTSMDTCTNVRAGSDASDVRAAQPADMTDACTDVSGAKTSDRANAADMRTATKATHVTAAKATAYTAAVATTAAARFCLYRKQARRQQRGRQNGHHFSHHFLHSIMESCAPPTTVATPKIPMSSR